MTMIARKTFTLLALAVCITLQAQQGSSWYRYRAIANPTYNLKFPVDSRQTPQYVLDKEIRFVRISKAEVNKRGKEKAKRYSYVYSFDDKGMVSYLEGYKKGKKKFANLYTYDDLWVASKTRLNKKGEIEKSEFYLRDDSSISKEYVAIEKGDTTFRSVVGEIKDGKSTDYYYKNGKLKYYWVNTYYPNKSLKQTTMYNGKGKAKYIWDYQCKEDGVEIKKQKDTTTRCEEKSTDANGVTTFIYHTVNEKGETFQTINKRNKAGKYFYYKRTKGVNKEPIRESITTYLEDDTTKVAYNSTSFKKGEIAYQYNYTYDKAGNETSRKYTTYKKGKLESENVTSYEYDDSGRPVRRETSDKLSAKKQITLFDYSYNEKEG
jgi:YD repeat-containing protein